MKHRLILLWMLTVSSGVGFSAEEKLYPMFFREQPKVIVESKVKKPLSVKKVQPKRVHLNGCLLSGSYQALWLNGKMSFKAASSNKVLVTPSGECFLQRGEQKIQVGERFVFP